MVCSSENFHICSNQYLVILRIDQTPLPELRNKKISNVLTKDFQKRIVFIQFTELIHSNLVRHQWSFGKCVDIVVVIEIEMFLSHHSIHIVEKHLKFSKKIKSIKKWTSKLFSKKLQTNNECTPNILCIDVYFVRALTVKLSISVRSRSFHLRYFYEKNQAYTHTHWWFLITSSTQVKVNIFS